MVVTGRNFSVFVAILGLIMVGLSAWLAKRAVEEGGSAPRQAWVLGVVASVGGWYLFWAHPPMHGGANFVGLLLVACAYPLVAVEAGRAYASRILVWASLGCAIPAAACDAIFPIFIVSNHFRAVLYFLTVVVPPTVAAGVLLWRHFVSRNVEIS